MKIAGLTLPQFAGAIIVGLIVSFALVVIMVPHDDKPIVQQSPQNVVMVTDIESMVTDMVGLTVLFVTSAVIISLIFTIFSGRI
jgi:hypothetical protein